MARKRLTPARSDVFSAMISADPEPRRSEGALPPISRVAGDSAAASALAQLSDEVQAAREGGRMVLELPLGQIVPDHLVRDRIEAEPADLEVLKRSLAERGQQTPIEVVALGPDRYGLISGWRRLVALGQLAAETGEARFASVLALLRCPEDQAAAWTAMVEENEIRADLSFYERARIVAKAVGAGVYEGEKAALQGLFPHVSYARRSKIKSFLALVAELDGVLQHPARISERQGLRLAKAMADDSEAPKRMRAALKAEGPLSPEVEARVLEEALHPPAPISEPVSAPPPSQVPDQAPGPPPPSCEADAGLGGAGLWRDENVEMVFETPAGALTLRRYADRIELAGPGLTEEVGEGLCAWLAGHGR